MTIIMDVTREDQKGFYICRKSGREIEMDLCGILVVMSKKQMRLLIKAMAEYLLESDEFSYEE